MKIEAPDYQIARLENQPELINILTKAESEISKAAGSRITLIAYSQKPNQG